ncbi:TonB-dependent siderophore receptor, partial [Dyella sp.]|uniref:TonB-dependent siderophore receptor n=1 Tax=Dyella sp. TaxID=1869338 RepID=UPI002ED62EE8
PGNTGDHAVFRTARAVYGVQHMLGEDWTFQSRGQYVDQRDSGQDWSFFDTSSWGDADAIARSYRYSDTFYTMQNDLSGHFSAGGLDHRVVLGVDFARTRAGTGNGGDTNLLQMSRPVSLNLFTGFSLPSAREQSVLANASQQPLGAAWSSNTGVFLQDQIAIGDQWDVLAAVRRTSYELTTRDADGDSRKLRKSRWVPKLGVVYKPLQDVALYASSATGFQVDSMIGQDGQPLPPSVSRQLEVGAKFDLFDQRARLTTAWYRIKLDHSVDLVSPEPPFFAIPGPGQTNHGVEMEFTGQVTRGLDVTASFTDARIHNDDNSIATGSPRRQGSLWASYRFQRESLQGWGVAGGVFARSRTMGRSTDDPVYFAIPGQASVEANISYSALHWRTTFGVKNLFARTLYAIDASQNFVPVREGRVWMLNGVYDL